MKENGVDLKNIQLSKKINGKQKEIKLSEIEQEGIDIKDKLKSTVSKHVSTNQETRAELARQEKELTGNRENEGEIKDD